MNALNEFHGRSPVEMMVLPHNGRMDFDPQASEDVLGAFVSLPIRMPTSAMAWVDPTSGKPLAVWCDGGRIAPTDFLAVLTAIEEYNRDLAGMRVPPPENLEAIARNPPDDDGDDARGEDDNDEG